MADPSLHAAAPERDDSAVLIVGGGPVGLALAGDLGWRGRSCILIEQSDGTIHQPRQDLVGVRTMEFCRRWGIVGDVEAAPYDRDYPQDNVYIAGSLAEGWEIGRYAVPSMNHAAPPPESPQKRERCPQNMFDPILRHFAASHATVTLRYRARFEGLRRSADGVVAEIVDTRTGRRQHLAARFLVGCDGASSVVRAALGTTMTGNPALTFTTNIMFRCKGFEALHDKRPGYRFIFIGPEGTWATIVAIDGRDEWRMSIVRSSEDGRALDEREIRDAIVRAVGRSFDHEILSVMPWRRRELVAETFGEGPAFIAGDAAHAMSPTGGFGMNTGIGDAIDLSWKIDAVLAGWGGGALLGSYTPERRPVAERNVTEASGNLARMLSPPAEPGLLDRTPDGEVLRRRIGERSGAGNDARMADPRHPSRLCLRGFADLHPRQHAAAKPRSGRLRADRAAGISRAARLPRRRPVDARFVRPRLRAAEAWPVAAGSGAACSGGRREGHADRSHRYRPAGHRGAPWPGPRAGTARRTRRLARRRAAFRPRRGDRPCARSGMRF